MGSLVSLRKAYAIRRHGFYTLIFNAAEKLGVQISFYHLYCLRDPGKAILPADVKDHFVVRREPAPSRLNAERISVWDGEEMVGEVFVTSKTYHVDYIGAYTALDGPYLFSIRIRSGRRSRGLARRLNSEAIRASPDSKFYALVAFTNTPSRRLIESFGFEIVDQVIYINVLGRIFRNRSSMKYFQPEEPARSAFSAVDVPIDRSS